MDKQKPAIGSRVRIITQHWLRAHEEGCIIDHQFRLTHGWLVQFDHRYPGGGIDGDKLWLDESQFSDISCSDNEIKSAELANSVRSFGSLPGLPTIPDI